MSIVQWFGDCRAEYGVAFAWPIVPDLQPPKNRSELELELNPDIVAEIFGTPPKAPEPVNRIVLSTYHLTGLPWVFRWSEVMEGLFGPERLRFVCLPAAAPAALIAAYKSMPANDRRLAGDDPEALAALERYRAALTPILEQGRHPAADPSPMVPLD